MDRLDLKSWSFVHVLATILELAKRGRVDIADAGFLREGANVRTWEVLDELGRDAQQLGKRTPSLYEISAVALRMGADKNVVDDLCRDACIADRFSEKVLGDIGYSWLNRRQIASQLIFVLASHLQGDPHDDNALDKRQARSESFLRIFFFSGRSDPEFEKEAEKFERQLGVLYCLRAVSILATHPELDLVEIARHGLLKYGVSDLSGRNVCYWCSGTPCVCGGRKGGMKAKRPTITREHAYTHGLPEMDRHMIVYGVGRNSAIDALAGVVRSFSEDGGEYGWLRLVSQSGGTVAGVANKFGSLHVSDSRHPVMLAKKETENVPLSDSLYAETADAMVSWPCLVTQAFGLNFVRSVKLGLEHMAKGAGVDLRLPHDLTRTVPAEH